MRFSLFLAYYQRLQKKKHRLFIKIYAFCRKSGYGNFLNTIEEYNPSTNTWTAKANMPDNRIFFATAAVNNKIYIIGGMSRSMNCAATVFEYNILTNAWTTKASMPSARRNLSATVVNNKIYVIGGYDLTSGNLNKVEVYDPATDTWLTKANMPTARHALAVEAINDKIYALGGVTSSARLNLVEEYDVSTNIWTTRTSMPTARERFGSAVVNGKIYAVGGFNVTVYGVNEEYTPPLGIPILTATSTSSSITVSWNTIPNATGYDIEIDGSPTYVSVTNPTYLHTGLTPNTQHTYRVRAKDSVSAGDWSQLLTVWTLLDTPVLTATPHTTSVDLSWNTISGATSYDIQRDGQPIGNSTTLTYTDSNLQPGTQHTYTIQAKSDSNNHSDWSTPVSVWTLLDPPVATATTTPTTILLNWNVVSGATTYDVEADGVQHNDITDAYFLHSDLTPGTQHTYKLRVKNANVTSDWTSPMTISTPLDIPTDVGALVSNTSLTFYWDSSLNATSYDIEVDGVPYMGITNTYYPYDNLTPGTEHTFKVKAKNANAESNWSPLLTIWTLLDTPINLNATVSDSMITLTWDSVANATEYEVEVDEVVGNFVTNNSFQQSPAIPHTYRVKAKNDSTESDWSNLLSVDTQFYAPKNLKAVATDTTVTLTWDKVANATSYEIEANDIIVDSSTIETYVHNNLTSGTQYKYRVRAKNASGVTAWSNYVTATTFMLAAPANFNIIPAITKMTVSWDAVSGATEYIIEVDGIEQSNGNTTTFVQNQLVPGSKHTYRVKAKNASGESVWTELKEEVTHLEKPKFTPPSATNTTVTLEWNIVDGATSYDIEMDGVIIDSTTQTTYTKIGLTPQTQYSFRVKAKNDITSSDWSRELKKNTTK